MAANILDVDLSNGLPTVWGMERYDKVYALVRYRGDVLGWTTVANPGRRPVLTADDLRQPLGAGFTWPLLKALLKERLMPEVPPIASPAISVVVCCQARPVQLRACLSSLQTTGYLNYEIIVVDRCPADDAVARTAKEFGAMYIRSDRPQIDAARNQGLMQAKHDIVAFTLDRAHPDRRWLHQLGLAFRDPDVQGVTGLVVPSELETVAQQREFTYNFAHKFRAIVFKKPGIGASEQLWARHFGSGANMAFRRNVFSKIGVFDPALSVDSREEGAGDLEMLHRFISHRYALHYRPEAVVWLSYERSDAALERRVYDSGRYFGAYLLKCAQNRTSRWSTILKCFVRSWLGGRLAKRLLKPKGIPRRLVLQELRGMFSAPLAYRKGRALARQLEPLASQNVAPMQTMASSPSVVYRKPAPTITASAPSPGVASVKIIRTWYPHWGNHSGINQYIKYLDPQRFHVCEQLVSENDDDFPICNRIVQDWLRHRVQRHGMTWYNLSDFNAELRTVGDRLRPSSAALLHYLDGEHSAQFLPRRRIGSRPAQIVTYHQPADVLARVVRIDVAHCFDCITVVAPEQEEFFRAHVGTTPVRVILHGIDTDYYRPAQRTRSSATVTCITVGHNYRDYRAVRQVAERLRSVTQLAFHVVSPRPTGVEDLPNVTCHRGLSDDELLRLYQSADILFLPLTKATANNSLLEGMACGLPVVSTSLASIHAYTSEGTAILVGNGNSDQYIDALMGLVENESMRRVMAARARHRAEELDWRNIAPQFASLYAEFARR